MANSTTAKKVTPKKATPKVEKPVEVTPVEEVVKEEVEEVASVKEEIIPEPVKEEVKPSPKKEEPKPTTQSDKVIVQLPGGKYELRLMTPKGYKVLIKGSKEKCEKKAGL